MLSNIQPENILFVDIETVSAVNTFQELPEPIRKLWDKKSAYFRKADETAESVYGRAGIYAEFGKIVCISSGIVIKQENTRGFRIKSFFGHDEKVLLGEFSEMLAKFTNSEDKQLCGHNGKEFDFPYIARRMLINGLKLPVLLDTAGKKPWEVKHLDTMELWKFGDYKNYTSLELLAHIFKIPTPKDDIDGSMVGTIYWQENDLDRIKEYCQKDVLTTAQLFLKYKGLPLIEEENVEKLN